MRTLLHSIASALLLPLGLVASLSLGACESGAEHDDDGHDEEGHDDHDHDDDGHDDHGHDNESEIITTVTLTFTPQGGGDAVVASFSDPDGDGGMSGSTDPITLKVETVYDLSITFLNDLEDPAENITEEIEEEAEEHQVFITGDVVQGPAASDPASVLVEHAYADMESTYGGNAEGDDLPVGLANTITTTSATGSGTFGVRLQHLPEVNGEAQKVEDLAAQLAAGTALPGDADAAVEFALTVE